MTALLDTGASSCGVSRAIAGSLDLPSIGKQPIITAGGIVLSERYLFRVGFPQAQSFPFVFDDLTGFELTDDTAFQAVLGIDVLARCDVVLDRTGRCVLQFG
ncbi:hypothetical protein [uncultured Sphingomonas sp.]|uniref:hypothetical protein n=1 Tax=uncultured Sphingomonas sp. TaxID=158754 RepID=UPI0035CB82D7